MLGFLHFARPLFRRIWWQKTSDRSNFNIKGKNENELIKSQAEIICGRRGEILRTEGRNSPDGARFRTAVNSRLSE